MAKAAVVPPEHLDAVLADFPSPGEFVELMVAMDRAFDHLKDCQQAGWTAPVDAPDLVPAHEAEFLQALIEQVEGMWRKQAKEPGEGSNAESRTPRDTQFTRLQWNNAIAVRRLLALLAAGDSANRDHLNLNDHRDEAMNALRTSCKACDKIFRDTPLTRELLPENWSTLNKSRSGA